MFDAPEVARLDSDAPPPDPPVPPGLLALFGEAEIQARGTQAPAAPLPAGPTADQIAAARERANEKQLRQAERHYGKPIPAAKLARFSLVDNGSYVAEHDRPSHVPGRRRVAIWTNGKCDRGRAAKWNARCWGDAGVPRHVSERAAPAVVQFRPQPRRRGAGRPAARRAAGSRSGSDPGSSDPDEPRRRRFAALTFERFARLTAPLPSHWRAALHAHLPEPIQVQAWQTLREQTERERDNPPADIVALPPIPTIEDRRAA